MTHREKNLPLYVIVVGLVLMTVGYACIYYSRIVDRYSPVSNQELKQLEQEIQRLENLSKKGYNTTGE